VADELIEPTAEESRNGWSAEALTAYMRERAQQSARYILNEPGAREPKRPVRANSRYSPLRWRK
jgi:hypothetical protein